MTITLPTPAFDDDCPDCTLNHAFAKCCEETEPALVIINQNRFDEIFPDDEGTIESPTTNLCVFYDIPGDPTECCYCVHTITSCPPNVADTSVFAADSTICDDCIADEGATCITCVKCNDCDPDLKATYTVTFAGLAGDFGLHNGGHTLTRVSALGIDSCLWRATPPGADPEGPADLIELNWIAGQWVLVLDISAIPSQCSISFTGSANPCMPVGGFAQLSCDDRACADGDSCTLSAGAGAVVS